MVCWLRKLSTPRPRVSGYVFTVSTIFPLSVVLLQWPCAATKKSKCRSINSPFLSPPACEVRSAPWKRATKPLDQSVHEQFHKAVPRATQCCHWLCESLETYVVCCFVLELRWPLLQQLPVPHLPSWRLSSPSSRMK